MGLGDSVGVSFGAPVGSLGALEGICGGHCSGGLPCSKNEGFASAGS